MANDAYWELSKISGMSNMDHIFFLFFLQNDSQLAFTCAKLWTENKYYIDNAFKEARLNF